MSSSSSSSSSSAKQSKAGKKNRKTKKSKNKKSKKRNSPSGGSTKLTSCYIDSLNDPFEYAGCPLGWGCMVPTTLTTCYNKGTVTANADGTVGIIVNMNPFLFIEVANGGGNVSYATVNTPIAANNSVAINANFTEGRVISIGLRAYPNIAMTAAPGAVFTGAIPGLSFGQATSLTPNDAPGSPYMKQFRAYEGGTAVGRPIDTGSFAFNTKVVSSGLPWQNGDDLPFSVPQIVFIGLPAGTTVYFEAVLNIEAIAASVHGAAALSFNDNNQATESKLSNHYSSIESMWGAVKPYLAAAGRYGAQTALAIQKWSESKGAFGSYLSSAGQMTGSFQKRG